MCFTDIAGMCINAEIFEGVAGQLKTSVLDGYLLLYTKIPVLLPFVLFH